MTTNITQLVAQLQIEANAGWTPDLAQLFLKSANALDAAQAESELQAKAYGLLVVERDAALARLAELEGFTRVRDSLADMVAMMESGDEHGADSPWHIEAKAALAAGASPVQPSQAGELSDDIVRQAAITAASKVWPDVGDVGWTGEDIQFYRAYADAIIAAINAKGRS